MSTQEDPLQAAYDALSRVRRSAQERGMRRGRPGKPSQAGGSGEAGSGAGTGDESQPGQGLSKRRSGISTPNRRDPQLLDNEMGKLMATRGWQDQVQVGAVVGRWSTIVGQAVAEHVTPVSFEGSVLTVQADSSAWATQMQLLLNSVMTRIETEVGPDVVTEIKVKGPGGPSWRRGPLSSKGPGPRDTYG